MPASAAAAGQRISRIVLTHGHSDHSAGARRLAELTGAPVLAADPAHRLGAGGAPATATAIRGAGCELRVVATPGHTPDSVCLLIEPDGALLTGDTVLGRGTTVIARDGSLRRLPALAGPAAGARGRARGCGRCCPATGRCSPTRPGRWTTTSRTGAERLAEIEAALSAGDRTVDEIVARVYADVDRALWRFARWSVRAQLDVPG